MYCRDETTVGCYKVVLYIIIFLQLLFTNSVYNLYIQIYSLIMFILSTKNNLHLEINLPKTKTIECFIFTMINQSSVGFVTFTYKTKKVNQ